MSGRADMIVRRRGHAGRPPDPPDPDGAAGTGGGDGRRRRLDRRGRPPAEPSRPGPPASLPGGASSRRGLLASAASLAALLLLSVSRRSNVVNLGGRPIRHLRLPKADVGAVPTNGRRSNRPEHEDSAREAKAARASGNDLSNKHGERKDSQVKDSPKNGTTHSVRGAPLTVTESGAKSFPPGCHWSCYIGRYDDLRQRLERTEDAAWRHYASSGAGEGRDCRCDREGKRRELARDMPKFDPEPSADSLCRTEDLTGYCKNVTCEAHERDVDEKLLASALGKNPSADASGEGCRMLWFAAIHESDEVARTKQYSSLYTAALGSALLHAPDSLAPVLVVGRQGTAAENSTAHGPLGRWAEAWGATVLYSPRLSFHDHPLFRKRHAGRPPSDQGVFLRLDVPRFARERRLLEGEGICKEHILYTNLEVIFSNPITPRDVRTLATRTGDAVAMYGRQYPKPAVARSTGVLVMNVEKFGEEVPKMLDHLGHWGEEKYPELAERDWHSQGILNSYQAADDGTRAKFKQLPMHYNWKAYWGLEPSSFDQVKIVHFYGPKPNLLLDEVASCNRKNYFGNKDVSMREKRDYQTAFNLGICCDRGRVADWSVRAFNVISAAMSL